MRNLTLALAALLAPATAQAQRPDLTGVWIAAPGQAPANLTAAPSPVYGTRFGLKTEATSVAVTRVSGEYSVATVLPYDGARVTTPTPSLLCAGERLRHEVAAWDAGALVLTVAATTPAGGGPPAAVNNRTVLRLEAPDRLIVEGTLVQQGQPRQVGTVYLRTADPLPPPAPALPVSGTPATIDRVAWIGASWAGTTGTTTTEERWTPPASGGMIAMVRTLKNGALQSFEFVCIAERAGTLVYFAMPNARSPATPFVATEVTATSVTFENPSHDFPKVVRYVRTADGGLETTIAGAGGARPQKITLTKVGGTP